MSVGIFQADTKEALTNAGIGNRLGYERTYPTLRYVVSIVMTP